MSDSKRQTICYCDTRICALTVDDERALTDGPCGGPYEVIKEKWGWKEVPKEPRGYYQLHGIYRFRYIIKGRFTNVYAESVGYSTATKRKRRGEELQILREQAINHAKGRLDGYIYSGKWALEAIEDEVWIKF